MNTTKKTFLIDICQEYLYVNSYKGSGMSGIYHFQQLKRAKSAVNKKQKPFDAEGCVDEVTADRKSASESTDLYRYHD